MYSKKLDTSKKMANYFSKNLAFLRQSKGLSMAEMGEIIGMGKSIIGNYEKGTAEPSATTVLRIVQHFGITLQDLMERDLSKVKNDVHLNVHPSVHPNVVDPEESYTKKVDIIEHVIEHVRPPSNTNCGC
jgi:transcriptional regulator with XRE-family HTH domain